MTNVIITGAGGEHDDEVAQSFIKGYQLLGARYTGNLLVQNFGATETNSALDYAFVNNYDFVVQSTGGAQSRKEIANFYYPNVTLFMPAGTNDHSFVYTTSCSSNLYPIIICGTLTGNNEVNLTGYNTEFIDVDPLYGHLLSSYTNGFVAGKIAYIKDYFRCSTFQARMIARATASKSDRFTDLNGYGVINLFNATHTQVNIPYDNFSEMTIGNISANRVNNIVSINIDSVTNANYYKIYRNEELIYTGTDLNYTELISPQGEFNYKYQAVNNKYQTNFSNVDKITYRAYTSFFTQ